jgi:hypothetical protein
MVIVPDDAVSVGPATVHALRRDDLFPTLRLQKGPHRSSVRAFFFRRRSARACASSRILTELRVHVRDELPRSRLEELRDL